MCILFVHVNPNPHEGEYRLVVATNRDEYYKRPARMAFQDPETGIIGGQDMEPGREGGTWLGFKTKNPQGNEKPTKYCFSCLTNISGYQKVDNVSGRGMLVIDYLNGQDSFPEYIKSLRKQGTVYNGYNLIGVELSKDGFTKAFHSSNLPQIDSEYTGKHTLGFGNSTISSPHMKVLSGRNKFLRIVEKGLNVDDLKKELIGLLRDRTKCLPDEELARRSPRALHEKFSSIFVDFSEAGYGTRTHTIVLIDKDWNLDFTEVTLKEPINIEAPEWEKTVIQSHL